MLNINGIYNPSNLAIGISWFNQMKRLDLPRFERCDLFGNFLLVISRKLIVSRVTYLQY